MKKATVFFTILVLMMSIFSIAVSAATDNIVTTEVRPVRDKDFSDDINLAPKLRIRAQNEIPPGALIMVTLSPSAEWTYDDVSDISGFFNKNGVRYESKPPLTDDPNGNFKYTATIATKSDMQIITDDYLPAGSLFYVPLIVKLDGIAEASVSVSFGETYGITSGTYVFANRGNVNTFSLNLSASSNVEGNTVIGDVFAVLSAGFDSFGIELSLPAGFVFDESGKSKVSVTGEGSYRQAWLSEVYLNSAKTTMYLKIAGGEVSTSQGKLNIRNIPVNALESAADGDITMYFSMPSFEITNEKIKFGQYKTVEAGEQEPEPISEPEPFKVSATAGNKTIMVNGETVTLDVAPFNDETGRMMVPLRFLVNAFGMGDEAVNWDANKKEVTIAFANADSKNEIVFTIGSSEYIVNGTTKTMDTAAVIKEGYTFIPVRYAAEALGLDINYNEETKTAEFVLAVQ